MTAWKSTLAALVLAVGGLQAWDSRVADAGNLVIALVVLALALPAAAIGSGARQGPLAAAGIASLLMLVLARVTSPTPLPALLTIGPLVLAALVASRMLDGKPRAG